MKKIIAILLALTVMAGVTACAEKKQETTIKPTVSANPKAKTADEYMAQIGLTESDVIPKGTVKTSVEGGSLFIHTKKKVDYPEWQKQVIDAAKSVSNDGLAFDLQGIAEITEPEDAFTVCVGEKMILFNIMQVNKECTELLLEIAINDGY